MLIFGIDTCCMAATAALMNENVLVAQTVINHKKTHSQKMMPQIVEMFKAAELAPSDVDAYAAAVGPGSFTGVRIGVATVKAMAQAHRKPCIAVSTLEALAYPSFFFEGVISPILDARREQVYNALFMGGAKGMTRLTEDRALSLQELLEELIKTGKNVMFMGDGVAVHHERIMEVLGDKAFFAPKVTRLNLAGSVAELGLERFKSGELTSYGDLVPQYVRLSQAEQEQLRKKSEQ